MKVVKSSPSGLAFLNVACSFRAHPAWNNVDFSAYALLAHQKTFSLFLNKVGILSNDRYERVLGTDPDIIRHDLRKGIPFPDSTFDAVYNSHFLEHLYPEDAYKFCLECLRVMKKGAVLRVVVPDLEALVSKYTEEVKRVSCGGPWDSAAHQAALHGIFDQFISAVPYGTRSQKGLIRIIERIIRGGAAEAGEMHRWMYDQYSLANLLSRAGFTDIRAEGFSASRIPEWVEYGLDMDKDGGAFHKDSLYLEGVK